MKKVIENLANLIKIKSLFSLAVMLVFVVLALSGRIPSNEVMLIISMVVSFYFGTQHEKKATGTVSGPQDNGTVIGATEPAKTPLPAPVDAATYNEVHPDSV